MEGKILGYDRFRQCLLSEGGKHVSSKLQKYHILDKLKETGKREICEQCMQTWLAYQSMLVLTLFMAITFAKHLLLTILRATTLPGTLSACCPAQIRRVASIVRPRAEPLEQSLQASSPLAAFG